MQIPNLSFCVVICLYLPCITAAAFFSILRRLGDFTSRYRKKRFNSWTTQLCLWFTVAAFYSSTAAERTGSILWIKESIFCINNYCNLTWKTTIQPSAPTKPLLFAILCSLIWQCVTTWWTNYGFFFFLWLKGNIMSVLKYPKKKSQWGFALAFKNLKFKSQISQFSK